MAVTLANKKQPDLIARFIGSEVQTIDLQTLPVNNFVSAQWSEIGFPPHTEPEDRGMLYLYPVADHQFCLQLCYLLQEDANEKIALVASLTFLPQFFDQYPPETLMANQPFRFDQTTEQQFSVCGQARALWAQLQQTDRLPPFIQSLQQSQAAIHLLRRALECITAPFTTCQAPACRFLAYESEREKIKEARQILDNNISRLITIRELARMVAINECYLKKGFKVLVGKTIHDYQQELKIGKAKELLREKGYTVTEAAETLGYSSISHFSTAFKRITGMKPCELLS